MLQFPFYLTAIFSQVYNLYGTNSTIQITSTETSIYLQWSISDLNASYAIIYGDSSNGTDINRDNVTLPMEPGTEVTHLIEGLDPGQHYNIQLQKDGVLIFEDFIATKPLPVVSLESSAATEMTVTISWSPSSGSIQDKYQLFVTGVTDTNFRYQSPNVTTPSFMVPSLNHSQYYRATVIAFSYGEPSNQSAVIDFNTAPLPPNDVTVVAVDTRRLNISWTPHPDSTQDSFKIQYFYNMSNGNTVEVNKTCDPANVTECVLEMPGLPGQVYEVMIYSMLGEVVSKGIMTVHSTVPLPIQTLIEIPSNDTTIHLRWTIASDEESYIRHFVIHVLTDNGTMNWELNSDQRDLVLTHLQLGTQYKVMAYAMTGYEMSQEHYETFYTNPLPVETLTYDPATDSTTTSITAHWTTDQTALYDNFTVTISPQPENFTFPQTVSKSVFQYTFTNLSAGHAYLVSVATSLAGKDSETITTTFRTLPNKPVDVVVYNVSSSEATIQWNPPSGNIEQYRLTLSVAGIAIKQLTQSSVLFTFVDLKPGTEYDVKVESEAGGLFSEGVTQSIITNPSAVPSLATSNITSSSFTVTWEAPNNTNFAQYELRISPQGMISPIRLPRISTELAYTFIPLKAGQLYTVSIYTVQNTNILSERLAVNAVTSPLPVEDLTVVPYNSGLNVTWKVNALSQQSGFEVSYQESPLGSVMTLPIVEATADLYDYSLEIPDLFPGGRYRIRVTAWQNVSGEYSASETRDINGTTTPKPVENLTAQLVDMDTIEVDWFHPAEHIHSYYLVRHRPSLRDANELWVENSTYFTNFTLTGLFPGEQYEVEVIVVIDTNIRSEVKMISVVTVPLSPASVDVLTNQTTTDSVTLQWLYNRDATYVEKWLVTFTDPSGTTVNHTVPSPSTGTIIETDVGELVAGYHYQMTVKAVVQDKLSTGIIVAATTEPFNNITIMAGTPTNTSIKVLYTIIDTDYFDSISFSQEDTKEEIVHQKNKIPKELTFSGLQPGMDYGVTYRTISGAERSGRKLFTTHTAPNPPTVTSSVSAYDITLTISHPEGNVNTYSILCLNIDSSPEKDVSITAQKQDMTFLVDMLQPYMHYTCSVRSVYKGTSSIVTSVSVRTLAAPSSQVRQLKASENAPREVNLSWSIPEFPNGVISVYMVSYTGTLEDRSEQGSRNVTFPKSNELFNNLKAGWTYTFSVRAYTTAPSEAAKTTITLRTYKPSYRTGIDEEAATPKSTSSVGTTKAKVRFTNAFSSDLGEVIEYTVIVTEDKNSVDIRTKNTLPGWNLARNDPAIKAYQAIRNCSTFFDEGSTCDGKFGVKKRAVNELAFKTFEIGSETGCENQYYCNGPLKPDTTYYFTLRAYSTMDYSDTPFSEPIRTAAIPTTDDGSNVGGIVGGVIAAIAAIVVMIVIVLLVLRRRKTKSTMYRHNPGQELAHRLSASNKKTHVPILLPDFGDHVDSMKADSDLGYAEQFEDLKDVGRGQPCTAAELPCNRGKNRFTNILPYDHSRVKLLPIDDDEGSDYINANYVPGFHSKREYIVTQGPLPATRDDFWRLLWEQNVRNIVMLTKCVEKGREKCDHYWPNNADAVFYGDLQVALLNETMFPDWTIIEFKVSLGDQSRQVRHFHFTSWPDFGVPKKEQVLVRFVRMVREKLQKDGGPIIVHCSAGVGRSGTFVVIDRLLQRIKVHDTVDIYNTVAELRRERVWMVQTEQQYVCIHNSILCVVERREDEHIYDNVGHSNVAFEDDEGVDLN